MKIEKERVVLGCTGGRSPGTGVEPGDCPPVRETKPGDRPPVRETKPGDRPPVSAQRIRRAEIRDIPQIHILLNQVLLVHHVGRPDIFKEIGEKYSNEELEKLIRNEEDPIFVYEDEAGNILGHCFCQTINREEGTSTYSYKTLYIDDLCVHEDARRQHIGRALYEYACDFARKNGYYNVTLHAWECNRNAVDFYKRMGMKIQQYTMEEIL